jgi:hypothetical protein
VPRQFDEDHEPAVAMCARFDVIPLLQAHVFSTENDFCGSLRRQVGILHSVALRQAAAYREQMRGINRELAANKENTAG